MSRSRSGTEVIPVVMVDPSRQAGDGLDGAFPSLLRGRRVTGDKVIIFRVTGQRQGPWRPFCGMNRARERPIARPAICNGKTGNPRSDRAGDRVEHVG